MLLIASFLLNALANFALALLLARALDPSSFGIYALSVAAAGMVLTPCLEWLRHAATRFVRVPGAPDASRVRATLDASALVVSVGMLLLFVAAALTIGTQSVPVGILLPAALMVLFGALLDIHAATARAMFKPGRYAVLVALRAGLVLIAMVVVAYRTSDPAAVLWTGAGALALVLVAARLLLLSSSAPLREASPELALTFARYGFPLVAAGAVALVQAYFNRAAIAGSYGLAQAGAFALAWDTAIRVVAVVGTGADMLLFQRAVRTERVRGRIAARRELRRNAVIVGVLVAGAGAVYAMLLPIFETLFIDLAFQGSFRPYTLALLPGFVLWALIQFAIAPFLQIEGRTLATIPPLALALGVNVGLVAILGDTWGPIGHAVAFSLGMTAGFVLACIFVSRRVGLGEGSGPDEPNSLRPSPDP